MRAPTPSAAAEIAVPETTELQRKINNITDRMLLLLNNNLKTHRKRVEELSSRRVLNSPGYIVDDRRLTVLALSREMESAQKILIGDKKQKFISLTAKLEALNPMSVISRGYSAVFAGDGTLIKSVDDINIGDDFSFMTTDGTVKGTVTGKNKA